MQAVVYQEKLQFHGIVLESVCVITLQKGKTPTVHEDRPKVLDPYSDGFQQDFRPNSTKQFKMIPNQIPEALAQQSSTGKDSVTEFK